MGEEVLLNQYMLESFYPMRFYVKARVTAPIKQVDIIQHNRVIYTHRSTVCPDLWDMRCDENEPYEIGFSYVMEQPCVYTYRYDNIVRKTLIPHNSTCFYVRVTQIDGHIAWSSPIWIIAQHNDSPILAGKT